jgi:hypothetical protein
MTAKELTEARIRGLQAGLARSPIWQSPFRKGTIIYRHWIDSYKYVGEVLTGGKSEADIIALIAELKSKVFK